MRVDETLAMEAGVTVMEARAVCQEVGINERIDFLALDKEGLSCEALDIIHRKVNDARTKLKCQKRL